jgi:predicted enzyme related to lactoylglutathione lyase
MRPDQSGPPERKHAPDGDERQVSEVHNDGRIGEPDQHDSVDRRSLPLSRVDALQGKDVGMDEPRAEIVDVIIDCSDANRVASFWAEVLGRAVAGRKGPYVWLERRDDGVGIGFQRVAEPRRGKNRVHIDIEAADVVAVAGRIEALGGRRVEGYERGGFLVMADPEGNEFCVLPLEFAVDDDGNTDYAERLRL